MAEEHSEPISDIEIRGELTPSQEHICRQIVDVVEKLPEVEVHAMGMTTNMAVTGGSDSPCVWFTAPDEKLEHRISAAINTFRGKEVGVISDYHFNPFRKQLNVIAFGATLGKYVLPDVNITLEE